MRKELTGYRYEFCFVGNINIEDSHRLVNDYAVEDNIPFGITVTEITTKRYIKNMVTVLNQLKREGIGHKKSGVQASRAQQSLFAWVGGGPHLVTPKKFDIFACDQIGRD